MIQNINEAQARQYLTVFFSRLGLNDNDIEMAINKIPEHG